MASATTTGTSAAATPTATAAAAAASCPGVDLDFHDDDDNDDDNVDGAWRGSNNTNKQDYAPSRVVVAVAKLLPSRASSSSSQSSSSSSSSSLIKDWMQGEDPTKYVWSLTMSWIIVSFFLLLWIVGLMALGGRDGGGRNRDGPKTRRIRHNRRQRTADTPGAVLLHGDDHHVDGEILFNNQDPKGQYEKRSDRGQKEEEVEEEEEIAKDQQASQSLNQTTTTRNDEHLVCCQTLHSDDESTILPPPPSSFPLDELDESQRLASPLPTSSSFSSYASQPCVSSPPLDEQSSHYLSYCDGETSQECADSINLLGTSGSSGSIHDSDENHDEDNENIDIEMNDSISKIYLEEDDDDKTNDDDDDNNNKENVDTTTNSPLQVHSDQPTESYIGDLLLDVYLDTTTVTMFEDENDDEQETIRNDSTNFVKTTSTIAPESLLTGTSDVLDHRPTETIVAAHVTEVADIPLNKMTTPTNNHVAPEHDTDNNNNRVVRRPFDEEDEDFVFGDQPHEPIQHLTMTSNTSTTQFASAANPILGYQNHHVASTILDTSFPPPPSASLYGNEDEDGFLFFHDHEDDEEQHETVDFGNNIGGDNNSDQAVETIVDGPEVDGGETDDNDDNRPGTVLPLSLSIVDNGVPKTKSCGNDNNIGAQGDDDDQSIVSTSSSHALSTRLKHSNYTSTAANKKRQLEDYYVTAFKTGGTITSNSNIAVPEATDFVPASKTALTLQTDDNPQNNESPSNNNPSTKFPTPQSVNQWLSKVFVSPKSSEPDDRDQQTDTPETSPTSLAQERREGEAANGQKPNVLRPPSMSPPRNRLRRRFRFLASSQRDINVDDGDRDDLARYEQRLQCYRYVTLTACTFLVIGTLLFGMNGFWTLQLQLDRVHDSWGDLQSQAWAVQENLHILQTLQDGVFQQTWTMWRLLDTHCPNVRMHVCPAYFNDNVVGIATPPNLGHQAESTPTELNVTGQEQQQHSCILEGLPLQDLWSDWLRLVQPAGIAQWHATQDAWLASAVDESEFFVGPHNENVENGLETWDWTLWVALAANMCLSILAVGVMLAVVSERTIRRPSHSVSSSLVWRRMPKPLSCCTPSVFSICYWSLVAIAWVFGLWFSVGTMLSVDTCHPTGDDDENQEPNAVFLELLRQWGHEHVTHDDDSRSSLVDYWRYHLNECPLNSFPTGVGDHLLAWDAIRQPTMRLATSLQAVPTLIFEDVCGRSIEPLVEASRDMDAQLCQITQVLSELQLNMQCRAWVPAYHRMVHQSVCQEGAQGLVWVTSTQLTILILALLIWTFRVTFMPPLGRAAAGETREIFNDSMQVHDDEDNDESQLRHWCSRLSSWSNYCGYQRGSRRLMAWRHRDAEDHAILMLSKNRDDPEEGLPSYNIRDDRIDDDDDWQSSVDRTNCPPKDNASK